MKAEKEREREMKAKIWKTRKGNEISFMQKSGIRTKQRSKELCNAVFSVQRRR